MRNLTRRFYAMRGRHVDWCPLRQHINRLARQHYGRPRRLRTGYIRMSETDVSFGRHYWRMYRHLIQRW